MRGKYKLVRCVLVCLIMLVGVLTFASCAPQTAPSAGSREAPPSVLAVPNVAGPRGTVYIVGANFEPGEMVKVAVLMAPPEGGSSYETVISYSKDLAAKKGQMLMATDANGSFNIKSRAPKTEGVWPVRVYDEDENMIASSTLLVKKE